MKYNVNLKEMVGILKSHLPYKLTTPKDAEIYLDVFGGAQNDEATTNALIVSAMTTFDCGVSLIIDDVDSAETYLLGRFHEYMSDIRSMPLDTDSPTYYALFYIFREKFNNDKLKPLTHDMYYITDNGDNKLFANFLRYLYTSDDYMKLLEEMPLAEDRREHLVQLLQDYKCDVEIEDKFVKFYLELLER